MRHERPIWKASTYNKYRNHGISSVIVGTSIPSTVQIVSYPSNLAQARCPHRLTIALTILFLCLGSHEAKAAQADSPAEIVLGMSTVLTGNAGNLGKDMQRGILAGLERANRNGGVNGRKLRLISLDDGYEPTRTAPNMRQLIEKDHVLAIIGNVGTPTAIVSVPLVNKLKTLLFAPFSGGPILRNDPPDRYVINFRASYAEETAAMLDALIDLAGLKPEEIAFFTQRDSYGDAGFTLGMAALQRHGLRDPRTVLHVGYERIFGGPSGGPPRVDGQIAGWLRSLPPRSALRSRVLVVAGSACWWRRLAFAPGVPACCGVRSRGAWFVLLPRGLVFDCGGLVGRWSVAGRGCDRLMRPPLARALCAACPTVHRHVAARLFGPGGDRRSSSSSWRFVGRRRRRPPNPRRIGARLRQGVRSARGPW